MLNKTTGDGFMNTYESQMRIIDCPLKPLNRVHSPKSLSVYLQGEWILIELISEFQVS